jgi:hypothetical protein
VRTYTAAVLLCAIACGTQDVEGDRKTDTYVIEEAEPNRLVLRRDTCATERMTATWDPTKKQRSHTGTNFPCLAALKKGQTIEHVHQRIKRCGQFGGKVYRAELGGCDANDLDWKFEGTRCPSEPDQKSAPVSGQDAG